MLRFRPSRPGERSRRRAARALFIRHGIERTPEGRSLRLLRQWLSPAQRAQFAEKGYFEVVGGDTGKRYRIYAGAVTNVCEVDENGRPTLGLCFLPMGELPIGDVMLSQKIALESSESRALAVARRFRPGWHVPARSASSLSLAGISLLPVLPLAEASQARSQIWIWASLWHCHPGPRHEATDVWVSRNFAPSSATVKAIWKGRPPRPSGKLLCPCRPPGT